MDPLLLFEDCKVIHVRRTDQTIAVTAQTTGQSARCPACRELSCHSYGSYVRRPKDLPIGGRAVCLELRVKRFRCLSTPCARHTFSVSPPRLVRRHARRTLGLDQAQSAIGVALGGEAGARLVAACLDLNDNSIGAWACVSNAITDAVELLAMVGSADRIDDPLFQGISDPAISELVEMREDEEQGRFVQRMWGGNMYQPLH